MTDSIDLTEGRPSAGIAPPTTRQPRGYLLLFLTMIGLVVPVFVPALVIVMARSDEAAMRDGRMPKTDRRPTRAALVIAALLLIGQLVTIPLVAALWGEPSTQKSLEHDVCERAVVCCLELGAESECQRARGYRGAFTGTRSSSRQARAEALALCDTELRMQHARAQEQGRELAVCEPLMRR